MVRDDSFFPNGLPTLPGGTDYYVAVIQGICSEVGTTFSIYDTQPQAFRIFIPTFEADIAAIRFKAAKLAYKCVSYSVLRQILLCALHNRTSQASTDARFCRRHNHCNGCGMGVHHNCYCHTAPHRPAGTMSRPWAPASASTAQRLRPQQQTTSAAWRLPAALTPRQR